MLSFIFLFFYSPAFAKTVHYELNIENKSVNLSGKKMVDFALTVNGGIPAPVLEFTEGDDAEIVVKNSLKNEEASIHWHGILLPPEEDGVAYVNTPPIHAGQSRTFRFPLRQHGTYWYHSHTGLQEQKGVFGAIVIHPKKETIHADKEAVVIVSDWSDENPDQILRNLKKDGDYYLYKKKSVRSYFGALRAGKFKTFISNEWQRMGGMDLSDVGYDAFLINGQRDLPLLGAKAGEKVRLRIINAGSSSYFYVSLAGLPLQVISADGVDIQAAKAKEILMGMAETYDVLFTVPENKSYELRATAQDISGAASAWIGNGEKVFAQSKPAPDMYAPMDHAGHAGGHAMEGGHAMHDQHAPPTEHSMHGGHHHEESFRSVETMTVDDVQAAQASTLPKSAKVTELKLVLDGDMRRYVWHINGKAIFEERDIPVNEGDVLRITYENKTMMHHPMHLHGHFFRVINQFGERSPLKHTVDVPPHGTRTIEFYADEPGQWMLHCHNLYHMHSGMARVVKYLSFKPPEHIEHHQNHDPHMHDHFYFSGSAQAYTNQAELFLRASQTWNEFEVRGEYSNESKRPLELDRRWEFEGDVLYSRWFGNYSSLLAGATSFGKKESAVVGAGYIFPLLIDARVFVNHEGKFRLDLARHFQWTSLLYTEAEFKWRPSWKGGNEMDIKASFMYRPTWAWAAGLMFTTESVGAGAFYKF